jgi:hypothetical protein
VGRIVGSGAAFHANDDAVLPRTAEIPGENVGLGGRGCVHGSVGLRRLSDITVWRWCGWVVVGYSVSDLTAAIYYMPRALRYLCRCPDPHPIQSQPLRTLKLPVPLSTCACPLAARPTSGPAGADVGSGPALEHQNRPHPSGGGDGISRRRGFGALENTRIAPGRHRVPFV